MNLISRTKAFNHSISSMARSKAMRQGDIELFAEEVCKEAAEIVQIERVSVWLFENANQRLYLKKLYQLSDRLYSSGAILTTTEYPNYFKALEEERSIVANDAHSHTATSEFSEGYLTPLRIFSMLDCPIRDGVNVIGVICLEHVGEPRSWTEEEVNFASVTSDLLSLAVAVDLRNRAELKLQEKSNKLAESNITLQTVLGRIEEEKKNIREDVALNIEKNIQPLIEKLKGSPNVDLNLLGQLESGLSNISSNFYKKLVKVQYNLTPTERKVCQLIKTGYLGKEIAAMLSLSYSTIETHKKNIRRKLELTNKSVNLKTYLEEIDQI
ncbi:MAG: GAF domain-containing protein [Halobacteriovoraceae bacterium]|jgi:DNA-binding CsgD family transcriptional regulator|nr:GAF domain-containing protein [Halobacteriovoraceae bacterium]MBT5093382.1 GAF domain-containing protein [Halobacteriovoraceae bacterium]